jgi:hypothetical protein
MGQPDVKTWRILIEPTFMQPEVSFPISGARTTVLVPGYLGEDGEPQYIGKKDWDALKLTWEAFCAQATANRTERKIRCALARDANKVVQYATISSDDPLTATLVLAPDFLKRFQDVFGSSVLVAMPNRYTVYVFPGEGADYTNYSRMILGQYHDSSHPVSREIFNISTAGIKAIGMFEDE